MICRHCKKPISKSRPAMVLAGEHTNAALCGEALTESPMELRFLRAFFDRFSGDYSAQWETRDWPDQPGPCINLYNSSEGMYLFPQFNLPKIGYRLDFAIIDDAAWVGLAIEVDGHAYHSTKAQRTRDAQRDRRLLKAGWRVMRFTGTEVRADPHKCVEEICRYLHKEND